MAGEGTRFQRIGLKVPKYKIIARDKTLFEWSIDSLKDFFDEKFIFITNDKIDIKFLNNVIIKLGIRDFEIIRLSQLTSGQAETAMYADDFIDLNESFFIYNIDTAVTPGVLNREMIDEDVSGFIPVMKETGNKWSYVKLNPKGAVIGLAEKKQISDLATIGFYYFSRWGDFKDIYLKHKGHIIKQFREVYVAPMYNYLISEKREVKVKLIKRNNVNILGTPEEVASFDPDYLTKNCK